MALKWSLIERPAALALARKVASSSAVRTSPRLRVMRPSSSGAGAGAVGAWVGLDAVAVMAGVLICNTSNETRQQGKKKVAKRDKKVKRGA